MKAFFKTLAHAAVGGFAAGIAGFGGGAHIKAVLLAGAGSAITSVFSLLSKNPAKNGQ